MRFGRPGKRWATIWTRTFERIQQEIGKNIERGMASDEARSLQHYSSLANRDAVRGRTCGWP